MSEEQYLLYRDGLTRYLLQNIENGIIAGLLFPALPSENARAFSYDYGSIWYPHQIVNLSDFPELADMPFFTIESCSYSDLDRYFNSPQSQAIYPLLAAYGKLINYSHTLINLNFNKALWTYEITNPNGSWKIPILSLWCNQQGCFVSNRDAVIIVINHQGQLINQQQLPMPTRCLEGIENQLYVGCDDGQIYKLTGQLPEFVHRIRPSDNYNYSYQIVAFQQIADSWLIADAHGKLTCLSLNWEQQWQQEATSLWFPYLLCGDDQKIYQGYYQGLRCLEQNTGKILWQTATNTSVLCGALRDNQLIFGCSDRSISMLSLNDPNLVHLFYQCTGIPYCITITPDGQTIYVSDYDGKIYVLDITGNLQAIITLESGAATAMAIWRDHLYVATNQGIVLCFSRDLADFKPKYPSKPTTTTPSSIKTDTVDKSNYKKNR